jgi:PAS domain S-box-containing protein
MSQGNLVRQTLARRQRLSGGNAMIAKSKPAIPGERVARQLHAPPELFLETIASGFLALKADWTIGYANTVAAQICGLTPGTLVGRRHDEVFPAIAGTVFDQRLREAKATCAPVDFESDYPAWQRWFHVRAVPLPDGELSVILDDITDRKVAEQQRAEALEEAQTLNEVAAAMAGELDLHKLVQIVTDAATKLTGANFGAFFYNVLNEKGESYLLYTLSGAAREEFEKLGMMPRNTPVFEPTFRGTGVVRSDDITKDPRYGTMSPHHGMPNGHLPVCSYLAAPVISRSGEVLGGLFFGHSEPGQFTAHAERLAVGIAVHAAIAIDNARLYSKAEQELGRQRAAEAAMQLLGAIVDSSDDAIISKDLKGVITSWNKSAERLFGYTAEEAVGRSVAELLIPANRQDEEPNILQRLARGERVDHFETIRRRKDGTLLDISLTISPVKDSEGAIVGASKIARDITQRRIFERRLVEQARLLDLTGDAILVRDKQDRILFWNRAAEDMYGFTREEALGKISHELLGTEFPEPLPEINKILLQEGRWSGELSHASRSGSRRVTLSRWVAEIEEGEVIRILESNNDITERVRVQEELRRANTDLEQFAYSASHDLQEPLRTIKVYSELLTNNNFKSEEGDTAEYLGFLRSAATRMELLVRDLLAYTKISLLQEPDQEEDANQALADALANLGGAIEQSNAQVTHKVLPAVRIHAIHLQQLFQNLIGNSIKYRDPQRSPVVHVTAERRNETWVFSVQDNGIGIAPEFKEQIFGLFTRLHNSQRYSGTGIGLAICHRIVERYHGRIWVESEPGRGSTFRFSIPIGGG